MHRGPPPPAVDSAQCEINNYLIELRNSSPASDPLQFWEQRMHVYPRLQPLAQALICASASQAFVERIFSVCGLLTEGRRNRTIWKYVYFCVLMLTLSRNSDTVTVYVVGRTFATDCLGVGI